MVDREKILPQGDDKGQRAIVGILSGPTASGKSVAGVEVARRHNLAIISGDSMQVYCGMEIGTGVIGKAERRGIVHHLIGVADPEEDFHAARFVEAATAAARQEWTVNGRRSLVVGGTGMWIQALREGLFDGPGRDETVRRRLRGILANEGAEALHERLRMADPEMADQLSPKDHVRVVRALEVFEVSGRRLSEWYREDQARRNSLGPLLPLVVLAPPRDELYRRIDCRVDEMIAAGWQEEARALRARNLPAHAPAGKALGYRELIAVLDGRMKPEEAIAKIRTDTRRYAKRQMTWFRGQRDTTWLDAPDPGRISAALGLSV